MDRLNLPSYANHLKSRLSSFLSADHQTELGQSQIYCVMLVSALVSRNYSFAREIENIIGESTDKKAIALAKVTAKFANMNKNVDPSSSLDSEVVKIDFWIYMLAALFICNFGSYIKLCKELQKNKNIDEDTIHNIILIAGTVQSMSIIHKVESERKNKMNLRTKICRHFYTSEGWFINMRSGDEKITSHIGFRKIKYRMEDNIPTAGPFKCHSQLYRWFYEYISLNGYSHNRPLHINDNILIPESNRYW